MAVDSAHVVLCTHGCRQVAELSGCYVRTIMCAYVHNSLQVHLRMCIRMYVRTCVHLCVGSQWLYVCTYIQLGLPALLFVVLYAVH